MLSSKRPNIVFFFSDQQRADTIGCYGQPLPVTPRLDQLAQEGLRFEWAFSPQPVCGPCRALFQSGRYPTETGCFRNNKMLPHNIKTLANYIEEAGYETAYIGKWHLASEGAMESCPEVDHRTCAVPLAYRGGYTGFWRAADMLEFTSHGYDGYVFDENNRRIDFKGYRADCITDLALDFFDVRDKNKPFFMTISHIEPHHQNDHKHYEGPEGSKEKYRDCPLPPDLEALGGDARQEYPDYLGQCNALDRNLGRVIDRLKAEGIYEDTVIIYASDHGSHFRTRNTDSHLNGYDDYKRTCHDSALRVPFIIKGDVFTGGRVEERLVSTASLPKTILAIAGIDVGDKMIGEDLRRLVTTRDPSRPNEIFAQISESRVGRCIRTAEYLYAVYAPNVNGGAQGDGEVYADDYLYDLKKDPLELNNLIADPAYDAVRLALRERLLHWIGQAEGKTPTIVDGE